jgi:hypothetical protein
VPCLVSNTCSFLDLVVSYRSFGTTCDLPKSKTAGANRARCLCWSMPTCDTYLIPLFQSKTDAVGYVTGGG